MINLLDKNLTAYGKTGTSQTTGIVNQRKKVLPEYHKIDRRAGSHGETGVRLPR